MWYDHDIKMEPGNLWKIVSVKRSGWVFHGHPKNLKTGAGMTNFRYTRIPLNQSPKDFFWGGAGTSIDIMRCSIKLTPKKGPIKHTSKVQPSTKHMPMCVQRNHENTIPELPFNTRSPYFCQKKTNKMFLKLSMFHHFSYGKIMEKSGISGELHPFSRFFPWKIHRNSTLPRCSPGSRSQRLARASPSASSASHRICGQGLPSSWETWMKSLFFLRWISTWTTPLGMYIIYI